MNLASFTIINIFSKAAPYVAKLRLRHRTNRVGMVIKIIWTIRDIEVNLSCITKDDMATVMIIFLT